jgi:hypothetical protein
LTEPANASISGGHNFNLLKGRLPAMSADIQTLAAQIEQSTALLRRRL